MTNPNVRSPRQPGSPLLRHRTGSGCPKGGRGGGGVPVGGVTLRRHKSLPGPPLRRILSHPVPPPHHHQQQHEKQQRHGGPAAAAAAAAAVGDEGKPHQHVNSSSSLRKGTTHSSIQYCCPRWHPMPHAKSNPYVGWFRHSPPPLFVSSSSLLMSKNPGLPQPDQKLLQQQQQHLVQLATMERNQRKNTNTSNPRYEQTTQFVVSLFLKQRGYLRGGGPDEEEHDNDKKDADLETFLQEQCADRESVTLKTLTRLACWFLDVPFMLEEHSTPKKCLHTADDDPDVASVVAEEDEDDVSCEPDEDDYDTPIELRISKRHSISSSFRDSSVIMEENQPNRLGGGLSSQAEAYYALSAVYDSMLLQRHGEEPQQPEDVDKTAVSSSVTPLRRPLRLGVVDESRLDYDITQMDIVRMNRIASRHLDVESIVRLPVRTYETTKKQDTACTAQKERGRDCTLDEDRSPFSMGTKEMSEFRQDPELATAEDLSESLSRDGEKHDTEFSWMLVPPPEVTRSFDDHSITDNCSTASTITTTRGNKNGSIPSSPDPIRRIHGTAPTQAQDDVCVICLEHFVRGDRMRVLPCSHSFHVGCIDRWLSGSHSFDECYTSGCPTCKKNPVSAAELNRPLDGSLPTWAFSRIGDILAQESRHF